MNRSPFLSGEDVMVYHVERCSFCLFMRVYYPHSGWSGFMEKLPQNIKYNYFDVTTCSKEKCQQRRAEYLPNRQLVQST